MNLYKSIFVNNSERTLSVIEKAMQKHDIVGDPKDYTLAQLLPDGGKILLFLLGISASNYSLPFIILHF